MKLPKRLRDAIWAAYRIGQERTMSPSREDTVYLWAGVLTTVVMPHSAPCSSLSWAGAAAIAARHAIGYLNSTTPKG